MTDDLKTDAPQPADPTDAVIAEPITPEPAPLAGHAPVKPDSPLFSDFAIKSEIIDALKDVGIEHTFAIQELTLPIALAGADLIGQARTGTGKTLGFGVPLLNRLQLPSAKAASPQALVIAPTRELAVQVSGDLSTAGKRLGAKVVTIYGGRAYEPQIEALKAGVDVIVGTPGRLLDLAQQGHLKLRFVRCLVLDEADEMLDLGFLPDIEKLMAQLPAGRQTMLFSATMPGPIVSLARQFLNQPMQIRAESDTHIPATEHVDQFAYRAHAMDKVEVLARILQANGRGLTMIFSRTKRTAQKIADELVERGFAAGAVHGDLGQGAREQALRAFRSGKVDVLVATDVAARGLDVDDVTHVINYQCPEDAMTYVHRIGRTARAGKSGTAVTLVDWDDLPKWKMICDTLNLPLHEPVETYSTSPHLYLELDIPTTIKGTLPRASRTRAGLSAEAVEDLGGPTSKKSGGGRERTRTGSGRSGSRSGGSTATQTGPAASGDEAAKPTRSSANRRRRRTRAGTPISGDAPAGTPSE
ncbi:DEAD/DEAH box helicase [Jatrophihabitans lederbergiae]|uniref:RNA helicase n=1 Tax=Jatrophihabitans lederbergiae TaxID=3075547 RepID=A0ABU2J6C1_9ACTN|nr:DEAD/DEAH box helicase [Jatrophihabitans sp. DSM 44399]MDT0260537.1 DEAD/DEAH box helicase [Jatrophihabitans sp. DSM 44399]